MNDRLLLTVEEAADLLGLGRSTVYELIGRAEIASVRIGRARRVPRVAVDQFVARLAEQQGAGRG